MKKGESERQVAKLEQKQNNKKIKTIAGKPA